MNDNQAVQQLLAEIWNGADIPSPKQLLGRMTAEDAASLLPGSPYSILTNLAHAVFWQDNWLARLTGGRAQSFTKDWRVPASDEFPALRQRFFDGFEEAMRISATMEHKMKSDEIAIKHLLYIAIHTSYHLGQFNVLKRQLRLSKKA